MLNYELIEPQSRQGRQVFLVASGSRAERTRPAYDATQGVFYLGAPPGSQSCAFTHPIENN